MFERKWIFQLALMIGVGLMVRGAYRTLLGDTSKIQSVEVAGLEEPVVVHPMHWSNIPRGNSPLTPTTHHNMMNPTITLAKPAIPNVPLPGAKPAVAKADEKTKKKKEAPKTAATSPAPLFNPAQIQAAATPPAVRMVRLLLPVAKC